MHSSVGVRQVGTGFLPQELAALLNRRASILKAGEGGVTFSGGEPLMQADFIAQTLGSRRPVSLPIFLANMLIGAHTVRILCASTRCRSHFIRDKLGWQPQYSNYGVGYQAVIEKWMLSRD